MKHIKRKFNQQIKLQFDPEEIFKDLPHEPPPRDITEIVTKTPDNYIGYVFTTDNEVIKCFKYQNAKHSLMIPEPDPVLVYFNTAQISYSNIEAHGSRARLIKSLSIFQDMTPVMHNLYEFFSDASSFAIFSFMAMESFVNKLIPDQHIVRNVGKVKTEEFDVSQIQQMELMRKIREVLPSVTGKNFLKDHNDKYQILNSLKSFRDEVVHTKKQVKDSTYYRGLFMLALDHDYQKSLTTVRDFINYYMPDLVEDCPCGANF